MNYNKIRFLYYIYLLIIIIILSITIPIHSFTMDNDYKEEEEEEGQQQLNIKSLMRNCVKTISISCIIDDNIYTIKTPINLNTTCVIIDHRLHILQTVLKNDLLNIVRQPFFASFAFKDYPSLINRYYIINGIEFDFNNNLVSIGIHKSIEAFIKMERTDTETTHKTCLPSLYDELSFFSFEVSCIRRSTTTTTTLKNNMITLKRPIELFIETDKNDHTEISTTETLKNIIESDTFKRYLHILDEIDFNENEQYVKVIELSADMNSIIIAFESSSNAILF